MNLIYVALLIFSTAHAMAEKASNKADKTHDKTPGKDVVKVLAGYREAKGIKAKVDKTVVQETLGTSQKGRGNFYFSKGKLRLEMIDPEPTTLVYDGKTVWFEQRIDDEHVLVTKMRTNDLRKSDSLLAALFDKKNVLEGFNLKSTKNDESKKTFNFEAKNKKKSDVQSLEITVKDKEILRISYKDRIENQVTLEFSDTARGEVPAKKFAYHPPKGAEITEP
jgi:outer membrane lipoprotein-sorting protein